MGEEEGDSKTFRPKFQSEFSMGLFDFQRIDKSLTRIDEGSALVNSCYLPELELMQQFFAQLINFFDDIRPLIAIDSKTKEFELLINEGRNMKRNWERAKKSNMPTNEIYIFKFVDLCNELKTKLYTFKQIVGLGIPVRRNLSTSEKIRRGVHGDKDFSNLPEA
jgi:hypothetical protein